MLEWALVSLVLALLFGPMVVDQFAEKEPQREESQYMPAWASVQNRTQALERAKRRRPQSESSERAAQGMMGRPPLQS